MKELDNPSMTYRIFLHSIIQVNKEAKRRDNGRRNLEMRGHKRFELKLFRRIKGHKILGSINLNT